MQVFDYHINPKLKRGLILKSFYFQPDNKERECLGNLCIVTELTNSLSRDAKIISNLANALKEAFFTDPKKSPEEALREALKKGNRFLEGLSDKGNVGWLGNLNLAVLALKDFNIHFSKTGNISILLLRSREYHDIAQNLEFQKPSPEKPIQLFSNIASGQLAERDKIIILTQDVFEFFHTNLASKMMDIAELNPKIMNRVLKMRKEEMKKISGILFLIFIGHKIQRRLLRLPSLKLPFLPRSISPYLRKIKKEIILIIALILILLISYLIFR